MNARATAVEAWRSLRTSASACESWQQRSTSITQSTLPPARDRLTAVGGTARRIPATIPQESWQNRQTQRKVVKCGTRACEARGRASAWSPPHGAVR